jgi:hypothetical protein
MTAYFSINYIKGPVNYASERRVLGDECPCPAASLGCATIQSAIMNHAGVTTILCLIDKA